MCQQPFKVDVTLDLITAHKIVWFFSFITQTKKKMAAPSSPLKVKTAMLRLKAASLPPPSISVDL